MKKIIYFILILIIIIFIIEIISFTLSKLKLLNFNQTPKIYQSKKYDDFDKYWNEKNLWGSWHGKNITVRHTKPCFDVIYKTNEIGARDDNFTKNKKKNLILLGDSFAEGFGVNKQFIFENYLEKKTEYNVLNFATSKDFGILQYYLIYENFAKKFDHDGVIISLLPNNDFKDNDYVYYRNNSLDNFNKSPRFRPYYILDENNNFQIIYPAKSDLNYNKFKEIIKNNFWFSNVIRTIILQNKNFSQKKLSQKKKDPTQYLKMENSYFDTPLYQQQAGIYFLKKLFKENPRMKFFIFSIPLTDDVNSIKENDKRNTTYWFSALKNLDKENENIIFLDLADFVPNNYQNYFFPDTCDGHWNKSGHKWAGKVLSDRIIEIFR